MANYSEKQHEAFRKAWSKIVARAWNDEAFKKRLLKNPEEVFKEAGVSLPSGFKYYVHEDSKNTRHFVLPERQENLSEEDLKNVASGYPTCGGSICPKICNP